jgi:hypothetical protein
VLGASGGARLRGGRRRPRPVYGMDGSVHQRRCDGVVGAGGSARLRGGRGLDLSAVVSSREDKVGGEFWSSWAGDGVSVLGPTAHPGLPLEVF